MDKYKKIVLKIFIFFIFITVLLIFFSNTIRNLTLPKVELGVIERGNLDTGIEAVGYVTYSSEEALFSAEQGEVTLFVERYDTVEKGELLYTIKEVLDSDSGKTPKVYEVYADKKYYVIDLFVDNGELITENRKVMELGDMEQLLAVATVTMGSERIDKIASSKRDLLVSNEPRGIYNLVGSLKRVYKQEDYTLEVLFESDDLLINEEVTVDYRDDESTGTMPFLLPRSAIYRIEQSDYIFVLTKEEGVVFDSYYVEQIQVKTFGKDKDYIAIDKESIKDYLEKPIVINADVLLEDGDQVSLVDGTEIVKVK